MAVTSRLTVDAAGLERACQMETPWLVSEPVDGRRGEIGASLPKRDAVGLERAWQSEMPVDVCEPAKRRRQRLGASRGCEDAGDLERAAP